MKPFFVVAWAPASEITYCPRGKPPSGLGHAAGGRPAPRALSGKRGIPFSGDIRAILDRIDEERRRSALAVLVSGDPCLYSLHGAIARRFSAEEYELVPGISSFQLACARARVPWDDAVVVSVHGRPIEELRRVPTEGAAVVFTDENPRRGGRGRAPGAPTRRRPALRRGRTPGLRRRAGRDRRACGDRGDAFPRPGGPGASGRPLLGACRTCGF